MGTTFEENQAIVGGWEISAVLDGGTCDECEAHDGETFDSWDAIQELLPNGGPPSTASAATACRCRPEPWPLLGVRVEGDAPKHTVVSTTWVARGRAEGWLTFEGEQVVHRPGGPRENPWAVTHTFVHGKAIVLHTVDGDLRYRIVTNPDKWPADKDGDLGFGGEVRWTYELKLEKAG
jgi:hypothetical protein